MEILKGHTSPETAYVVADYPYGYRLRCSIRYWLEFHPRRGFRFWSQTTNPKAGNKWNKAKASTYSKFGACMYLDANKHVHHAGLSEYCTGAEAEAWLATFGDGVPDEGKTLTRKWVAAKLAYDANRSKDDPLSTGLKEARAAFIKTCVALAIVAAIAAPAFADQQCYPMPDGTWRCTYVPSSPPPCSADASQPQCR